MRLNFYALFLVLLTAMPLKAISNDCPNPQNINFITITENSATLEWTSEQGPVSWLLEYGEPGFSSGEGTRHISYLKNYTLTGLQPGTNYHLYIKANCGVGKESSIGIPISFTTNSNTSTNPCSVASDLRATGISKTSATVTWNSPAEPLSWIIEYGEKGFTPGEGTTKISYLKNILLNNLEEETLYDVYVKSNCASGIAGPLSGPLTLKTYENTGSENIFTPVNDAVDNNSLVFTNIADADWIVTTDQSYDGIDAAKSGQITHYQSSSLQTTVVGPGTISFYWKVSSESNYDFLRFYINDDQQEYISGNGNWHQKEYTIPEGVHTLKWAYTKDASVNNYDDCGYVDNISFTGPNAQDGSCIMPQNLKVIQTNSSSTSLEWFSGSAPISYSIEYGEYDFSEGEGVSKTSYLPYYQLTNLIPDTHYEVRIKSNCGGGEESEWNSTSFYTDQNNSESGCSNPTDISINPVSPNSMHVKWNNEGTPLSWILEYGENGFIVGEGTRLNSYTGEYIINGLEAGTFYQLYIKTNCGSTQTNWTYTTFTTPDYSASACPQGYNFDAVDITTTHANIQWESDVNPVSWTIEYMPADLTDQSITVTSYLKNYSLTNLEPGTDYTVRVQANCGSGNLGTVSSFSFQTASDPIKLPFWENFDNANMPLLPTGWTGIGNVGTTSNYDVSYPYNIRLYDYRYHYDPTILVSPEFDQTLGSVRISFNALITYSSQNQMVSIGTMSDPNDEDSFKPVNTFDISKVLSPYQHERIVVYLNNFTTDKHVAIKLENNSTSYYSYLFIDDLYVEEIEGTPEPTLLAASRIDNETVTLSWMDNAYGIQWEVAYGSLWQNPDEMENRRTVFSEEAVIAGLRGDMNYAFYVRVAGSNPSIWSSSAIIFANGPMGSPPANTIGSGEDNQSNEGDIATAINDSEAYNTSKTAVSIYPNPVVSNLYIKGEQLSPETEVVITELSGKAILKSTVGEQPYDVSALPEGIYFLKVNEKTVKIIKK